VAQLAPRQLADRGHGGHGRSDATRVRQAGSQTCFEGVTRRHEGQGLAQPRGGAHEREELSVGCRLLVAEEAIEGLVKAFGRGTGGQGLVS
jgi:hypothetical protein